MVTSKGTLPEMIRNDRTLYEGNLIDYFRVVFFQAQNLNHPYHNFRHMMHVAWLCYQACLFYGDRLTPRQMRNILIAAMFHDFDHSGLMGNDDLNIERAIRGLRKHIVPEDKPFEDEIIEMIRGTEFPYKIPSDQLSFGAKILRDSDISQAFSVAWVQQVIFGLAAEWHKQPIEVLRTQGAFHRSIKYSTDWARETFTQEEIERKIAEADELLNILEPTAAAV